MKRKKKPSANSSPQPEISYIVSAYHRPEILPACLWSLKAQTHENFECIITDNSTEPKHVKAHMRLIKQMDDKRFRYVNTSRKVKISDCYWTAEWGAKEAQGQWLCFPCDDCYYLPDFSRRMLIAAAETQADVILSEFVLMGPEAAGGSGVYQTWKANPTKLVKSSFFVRASTFPGFSGKPRSNVPASADQVLGHELVRSGAKFGIAKGLTVVHN